MILQACINGSRTKQEHYGVPVTLDEIKKDAMECVEAGAAELHIHPRTIEGVESLSSVDGTIEAIRNICPGTLIGVSTGSWIMANAESTKKAIAAWEIKPDYASVNLSEEDAPEIINLLHGKNIGIEAGLSTIEDAERLLGLCSRDKIFRVLIEIEEQKIPLANKVALEIIALLKGSGLNKQILLHGFDSTAWHFVKMARELKLSSRIGFEDCLFGPLDDEVTTNADMVKAAFNILHQSHL
ncbi:TPA: 3-keto-5-aminohexanoate cleavage protein [Serratia marcescens]|uniref:3-keto-5-aminohexanoate cleavage protein n=1 Tax=Serratia marcescens TaxID=615 RepID=UPI0029C2EA25|nr:3-keto-5-aminohexanoate cleavage enzyme [Serratia marcescens]HEI8504918.1 3-keto-5-aminohexanoate cleavage protein [Serratia marcescens]